MGGHIATSSSIDWNTPQYIVDATRECFGGKIDLDPCSNGNSIVEAEVSYRLPINGLEQSWHIKDSTRCFFNPPYGKMYANKDWTKTISAKEYADLNKRTKTGDVEAKELLAFYSNKSSIKDWIQKAIQEYINFGVESIALTPAAVGVGYWQRMIFKNASAVCFLAGRVHFLCENEDMGPSPMDCAVSYFGSHQQHFLDSFGKYGKVIKL